MKHKFKKYIFLIILFSLNFFPKFSNAGLLQPDTTKKIQSQADTLGAQAGFAQGVSIGETIAYVIRGFLGLLGIIFLVLMVMAGHKWMTAGGSEEKVKEAKDTIRRAIIGLIIVIAAYSITYFVFENLPWGGGTSTAT